MGVIRFSPPAPAQRGRDRRQGRGYSIGHPTPRRKAGGIEPSKEAAQGLGRGGGGRVQGLEKSLIYI